MVKLLEPGKSSAELFPFNVDLECRSCGQTFRLEPGDDHPWLRVNGDSSDFDFVATRCPNPECGSPVAQVAHGLSWAAQPRQGLPTLERQVAPRPTPRRPRAPRVDRRDIEFPPGMGPELFDSPESDDDDPPTEDREEGDGEEPPSDPTDRPRRVGRNYPSAAYEDRVGLPVRDDGVSVRRA